MFHKDCGYKPVSPGLLDTLKAILKSKNIIIGGGGIWGLDFNLKVLVLSKILFVCRWILFKKVHLIGIGYYGSTGFLGKVSAFIAAKSSNTIITRDEEAFRNFRKFSKKTTQDYDLSFYLDELDLSPYSEESGRIEKQVFTDSTDRILLWFRLSTEEEAEKYQSEIGRLLEANPDKKFVLCLSRPSSVYKRWIGVIESLHKKYPNNTQVLDLDYNPVSLYVFMKNNPHRLKVIGPQFHIIAVVHLAKVKFFSMVYDNKVFQLLKIIGVDAEKAPAIGQVEYASLQTFVDSNNT